MKKLFFWLTAIVSVLIVVKTATVSQRKIEDFFYAAISSSLKNPIVVTAVKDDMIKPLINADAFLSLRINKSGREKVLLKQNTDKAMPIASLTKLMTALVVLENTELFETVTVSKEAASQNDVPVYGNLKEGESFSTQQLLDLMLIYSSNDAAFALSETMEKDIFVAAMNEKAKALGLKNTFFVNATGLDPEDPATLLNYSSCQDLLKLSKYIMKNHALIFEVSSKKGPYPTSNGFSDLSFHQDQSFVGGKTGYTEKAGGCMITVLKDSKDNIFINIILGTDSPQERVEEMQKIINWLVL